MNGRLASRVGRILCGLTNLETGRSTTVESFPIAVMSVA
jgi:hypothetical protein